MRIAIDGCDGTGKSTVAEKLANKLKCNIVHLTHKGSRSVFSYQEFMRCNDVVHDRTFISEIIYPKYFNRKSELSEEDAEQLFYRMRFHRIKVFILTASIEAISERIDVRGDEFITDVDKFKKINDEYLKIANEHEFTIIDTTNKTIDEIVEEIGGYLK